MSHYAVLVIGEKVEKQLAPYQENNLENCPKEFLTFYNAEKEEKEYYNSQSHKDFLEKYPTLQDYLKDNYKLDEETDLYGYWENFNSRWDWYEIGGRWSNTIQLKTGEGTNSANLKNIDTTSILDFQHVLKDGVWYESGKVGCWGSTSAADEDKTKFSQTFYDKFIKDLPSDTLLTVVDCHV